MLLTEDELFSHLRITSPDLREVDALALYESAAWDYIAAFTNTEWREAETVPAAVKAAALLLVADLYENREAQGPVAQHDNRTVERLLWPHRLF